MTVQVLTEGKAGADEVLGEITLNGGKLVGDSPAVQQFVDSMARAWEGSTAELYAEFGHGVSNGYVWTRDSEAVTAAALTAAAMQHDGAMVALVPSDADLKRLAIADGETPEMLHLTLLFLGDAADYAPDVQDAVTSGVKDMFAGFGPIDAIAFGVAYWNPNGEEPCWVLSVGDETGTPGLLHDARETAEHALASNGIMMLPEQHTPWVPHVCLAYDPAPDIRDMTLFDDAVTRVGPITFDRARIAFAGKNTDVPLGPKATRKDMP